MVLTKASLILLCSTVQIFIVEEPISLRALPRGDCDYCCPVNETRDIKFLLTTANNTKHPDTLIPGDAGLLEKSHFNWELPTVIYLHGFIENGKGMGVTLMREAYLRRGGWNIIIVDWESLSAGPFYISAVRNTKLVGAYLASFIRFLEENRVSLDTIHVVGFSLGAEAAGFAGHALKGRLARITGLDPAYPLFDVGGWDAHLSPDDAQFVDVIHSNGGIFGHPAPLGHVDFYPNSGQVFQPGCKAVVLGRAMRPYSQYLACSHQRAWRYYVESVTNECGFPGSKCASWAKFLFGGCRGRSLNEVNYMGIAAKRTKSRSRYYLQTPQYSPFGRKAGCPPSKGLDISRNLIQV